MGKKKKPPDLLDPDVAQAIEWVDVSLKNAEPSMYDTLLDQRLRLMDWRDNPPKDPRDGVAEKKEAA